MITEDNIMPNDGSYFSPAEPVEQTVARKKEKAHTLEALPILKELIEHFDTQIELLGSVDAMPKEVKTDPTKFMNVHNANEMARKALISEREWIISLLDTHAKNL